MPRRTDDLGDALVQCGGERRTVRRGDEPAGPGASTSRCASSWSTPSAAPTSSGPRSWLSDDSSKVSSTGSSTRRNRSINATWAAPRRGPCRPPTPARPARDARGRAGPRVAATMSLTSSAGGGDAEDLGGQPVHVGRCQGGQRTARVPRGPSPCAGRSVRAGATTVLPRSRPSRRGRRSVRPAARGPRRRSRWASSMTTAASGGSPARGGRATTVTPAARNAARISASSDGLPGADAAGHQNLRRLGRRRQPGRDRVADGH